MASAYGFQRRCKMTRKKKIEDKELDKELEKVQFDEEPTVELLKELVKVNQEIKDILSRLKDRFI